VLALDLLWIACLAFLIDEGRGQRPKDPVGAREGDRGSGSHPTEEVKRLVPSLPPALPGLRIQLGKLGQRDHAGWRLTRAGARAATGGNIVSVTATQAFEASIGACPVP